MIRRPWQVAVLWAGLLLSGPPDTAWAHPQHPATDRPDTLATVPVGIALSGTERGPDGPEARGERPSHPAPAATAGSCALLHHASPSPLALAAGVLALLGYVVVARRRRLALGLALVIAMASFEGVFHAALHLRHVSHPDGLAIGASAAVPTALSADTEIPAAPTPILLGPAPEGGDELGAGVGLASHPGRAPPLRPA